MKRIFLLFGSTGYLGKDAVKYFLDKNFDYYYFVSRKQFEIVSSSTNYQKVITGNLTKEENVEFVFSKIPKESSNVYFLFSTIGGYYGGKNIWETELEDWNKMLDMNLISSFLIAKHFVKFIIGTKGGSICFTSAESSFRNERGKLAYGLSKNGINYLVKSLANEGREVGLTANAVAPHIIDTPANREWVTDSNQLVTTTKICETVYNFFSSYPIASGEIVRLMH